MNAQLGIIRGILPEGCRHHKKGRVLLVKPIRKKGWRVLGEFFLTACAAKKSRGNLNTAGKVTEWA